ncbi:hypothetical protein [Companilactobacillus nantensis]|uniref:SnoaL-like domain-containing protein n=1 Tax=Companilactobacillus nantensis DSM 16982 TaxID=1423774 RepID=A0A0R1W9Z3_9LACO|nr:hypothetical protein [Companilactobacillus nantensis]KRM14705.1 hypothetical protein FD31_GL001701 [Companilactobacillus nantensis DSM 16982]GEO65351.1 hypothetical protein LNA01_25340 [Companilactobacillus nantensis]
MENYPSGYNKYSVYFLNLMMKGIKDDVDADSFWDAISDNATFTFHYHFPDFPRQMTKSEYKTWFKSYSAPETGADFLNIYKDSTAGITTLVMEYSVHYDQYPDMNFLSIAKIKNKQVIQWDDYLDTSNIK